MARYRILPPDTEDTEMFLSVHKSLKMSNRHSEILAISPTKSSFFAKPDDIILSFRKNVPESCAAGRVLFAADLVQELNARTLFLRRFPKLSKFMFEHEEGTVLVSNKKVGWPIYFAKARERFRADFDATGSYSNYCTKRLPNDKNWSKSWREDLENCDYSPHLEPLSPEPLALAAREICGTAGLASVRVEGVFLKTKAGIECKIRSLTPPSWSSKESYYKQNMNVLYGLERDNKAAANKEIF